MGKVASRLTKPLRAFNIDNRASRALEKQHRKGIASPKHPSTINQSSTMMEEKSEHLKPQLEKNEALHEKLKGFHIEVDKTPQVLQSSSRPLPEDRLPHPDTDMGVMDTSHTIPEGRANLKTILDFISQHQINSDIATAKVIAQEHKLDEEEVVTVLKHFKTLTIHIPQDMYKQNPNLKSIVQEQISAATSTVAQFQLSLPKEGLKLNTNPNDTEVDSKSDKT